MLRVKICGLTTIDDALACVEAGVDLLGVNFWPGSKRRCDEDTAREIVRAVDDPERVVGVFVNAPEDEVRRIREATGIGWVQLHGDEPASTVEALGPRAFKVIRVGTDSVLDEVRSLPGELLLLDAAVAGVPGGTGTTFDWRLAAEVAEERDLLLAGGLVPENVADAVRTVRPWGVDVASGVESAPGRKDLARVRAFVDAARGAW